MPGYAPTNDLYNAHKRRLAYAHCHAIARAHYENFPVASRLLPGRLRAPVSVLYAFARTADDIADEGDMDTESRLNQIAAYEAKLRTAAHGGSDGEDLIFVALRDVIQRHTLPVQPLYDLLTAFHIDITKRRYTDFQELLGYCQHSANPVGRLLLHLFAAVTPQNLMYSDAICTALQLTNFLQDLTQDYFEKGRIYLPQDEMTQYGVTEQHLQLRCTDSAMRELVDMQIRRTWHLLESGAPLGRQLRGRIGFELRLIIAGGKSILRALYRQRDDVFHRPRLRHRDWIMMLWTSLVFRRQPASVTRQSRL
jgi:squalene synthase HpnC